MPDISNVQGWLYDDEPEWLYGRAKEAHGLIVEVGSYMGKSTICLAQGAMDGGGGPVLAFDPQYIGGRPTYEQFLRNLTDHGVRDIVEPFVCRSEEVRRFVCDGEAALIFIDGEHTYQSTASDIDLLLPMLQAGGIMAVHDCTAWYPGALRAAKERLFDSDAFTDSTIRPEGSSIVWARKKVTSAPGKLR